MKTRIHKPKDINEAINDLEEFLICDLPSKVFPMDRTLGTTMFRQDYFETKKQIEKYIFQHFKILKKQVKELKLGDKTSSEEKKA